jgi:hypothetical protein
LFVTTTCPAATYYVRSGGSDSENGTSHALAWASLAKVNSHSFSSGDIVLFREGDRWEGRLGVDWSGTQSAHAVVGAYYLENGVAVRGVRSQRPVIDGSGQYPTGGIYDALIMVNTRDRVRIENIEVRNSEGRGVGFRRSHFGQVDNVVVDGAYVDGIHFLDSDNGVIRRSVVTRAGLVFPRDGRLHPWAAAITIVNSDFVQVTESTVAETYGEGINTNHGSTGTVIEKNRVFAARAVGIYSDAAPNTTIRRNIVTGTTNSEFWRSGSTVGAGIAINNETYHYVGLGGTLELTVQSSGARIYGNLVAFTASGIALWSALPETSHGSLIVANNTLIDNGRQIAGLSAPAPNGMLVNNMLLSLSAGTSDIDSSNLNGITARNNYFSQGNPGGGLSHSQNLYDGAALHKMAGWSAIYAIDDVSWEDFASVAGSSTVGSGDNEPMQMALIGNDLNLDFNELPFATPMDMGALRYSAIAHKVPKAPSDVHGTP